VPELLYIHGSGYTEESFKAQTEAFAGSDAVTLPGHPGGQAFATVEEASAWFARYVEWRHAGRAVAVGNSLGGAIALRWALDFPDQAAALVLVGTGARLRVAPDIFEMIERQWPDCIAKLVDLALSPDAQPALRERMRAWHLSVGQESTRRDYGACNRFDVMGELQGLKVPTLVIVGSLDRLTPVKYARYLHEHIAGSQLSVIEGAGHVAMAERPREVNASIASFLETVHGDP